MDTNPDRFLGSYFRASEKRGAPAGVRLGSSNGSTPDDRAHATLAWTWATGVLGALRKSGAVSDLQERICRHYYLNLSAVHWGLVVNSTGGAKAARVHTGAAPMPAADLQSFCDWRALALDVGVQPRGRAVALWLDAREAVRLELERRAALEAASSKDARP